MRIGLGQINARTGGPAANARKMLHWIKEARGAGCSMVVFPELALCGARPLDLLWNRSFLDACDRALDEITRASSGIAVVVGAPGGPSTGHPSARQVRDHPRSRHPRLTNRAYVLAEGKRLGEQDKQLLDTQAIPSEARYFSPGEGSRVLPLGGRHWGILVGEDAWAEDGPMEEQCALGAEWLLSLWASPYHVGRSEGDRARMSRRAKENGAGVVCVRLVGGEDDLVYDGGSAIFNARGQCIFQAPAFVEGLYVVDLESAAEVRSRPVAAIDEIRCALVLGIHDYVGKNGFSRVLIGLSGGVDSALVAALAVDAVGAENVRCVYLPSEFSSEASREDAGQTAAGLGVSLEEISIVALHRALRSALPAEASGLVDENLQPRLRGLLLMALSNQGGELVLCPGNKSEIAVGYSTLYGDTVGGLAPIADLYKEQVVALARAYGDRIPERVLTKPPSAELRPGQRDEDDLPAYGLLDPLLREIIEGRAGSDELLAKGYDEGIVRDVMHRLRASEYKRRQLPPGIRVTQSAWGTGRIRRPLGPEAAGTPPRGGISRPRSQSASPVP